MTREEAPEELDQLSRAVKAGPVSEREVRCEEMKKAAKSVNETRHRELAIDRVYRNLRRLFAFSRDLRKVPAYHQPRQFQFFRAPTTPQKWIPVGGPANIGCSSFPSLLSPKRRIVFHNGE